MEMGRIFSRKKNFFQKKESRFPRLGVLSSNSYWSIFLCYKGNIQGQYFFIQQEAGVLGLEREGGKYRIASVFCPLKERGFITQY
jgi:hypothetical protein